jgi:membrane protein implicated in regulation of membrane protease activity
VWGFIVAGHHARLAPLFIHLGLLLAGIALLIRLLLLLLVPLLARLLLTTAALLLIALIGHQVAPRFKGKRSHRSDVPSQRYGRPSLPDPINGRLGTTASPHIQDWCWRVASFPRTRRVNQIVDSVLKIKNPKPPAATRAVDGKF